MSEDQKLKRKMRNLRYREKRKTKTIKGFEPSKLDIAERDRIEGERQQELSEKYGTINQDCIKFRLLETNKDRNAFWFQHVESCRFDCIKWMKNQGFNLNASEKKFAELEGYGEFFKDSNSAPSNMGENKGGWVSICSYCGARMENGKCPNNCTGFT